MPDQERLLSDPLIGAQCADGSYRALTLPGVLAALSSPGKENADIEDFPSLQPHQRHAWYAFLVQLAAITRDTMGAIELPVSQDEWKAGLLSLSAGDESAWTLVVEDLVRPAFMQPPVPEGTLAGFVEAGTPESLDVLVLSKNHELKAARKRFPRAEHWVYALVTLQTMEGVMGRLNYGISRMNGGLSSRPCLAFAPGLGWSDRFLRDVRILHDRRSQIVMDYAYKTAGGHALLWTIPWDGDSSLSLTSCDPFFIEVCRRIRLSGSHSRIRPYRSTSTVTRLAGKEAKGVLGDPWTPVDRVENKALTVDSSGFEYHRLQRLLLGGDYAPGASQVLTNEDGDKILLLASVLVRGQGKTEGLHERILDLPGRVVARLRRPADGDPLPLLSQSRVQAAGDAKIRVLKRALLALVQGAPDSLQFKDDRVNPWLQRFERLIDADFFEHLWADADLPVDEADKRWRTLLMIRARRVLDAAGQSLPIPSFRRYRALAASDGIFAGARRRFLPEPEGDETGDRSGT